MRAPRAEHQRWITLITESRFCVPKLATCEWLISEMPVLHQFTWNWYTSDYIEYTSKLVIILFIVIYISISMPVNRNSPGVFSKESSPSLLLEKPLTLWIRMPKMCRTRGTCPQLHHQRHPCDTQRTRRSNWAWDVPVFCWKKTMNFIYLWV